jgi:hypothetical protein
VPTRLPGSPSPEPKPRADTRQEAFEAQSTLIPQVLAISSSLTATISQTIGFRDAANPSPAPVKACLAGLDDPDHERKRRLHETGFPGESETIKKLL